MVVLDDCLWCCCGDFDSGGLVDFVFYFERRLIL